MSSGISIHEFDPSRIMFSSPALSTFKDDKGTEIRMLTVNINYNEGNEQARRLVPLKIRAPNLLAPKGMGVSEKKDGKGIHYYLRVVLDQSEECLKYLHVLDIIYETCRRHVANLAATQQLSQIGGVINNATLPGLFPNRLYSAKRDMDGNIIPTDEICQFVNIGAKESSGTKFFGVDKKIVPWSLLQGVKCNLSLPIQINCMKLRGGGMSIATTTPTATVLKLEAIASVKDEGDVIDRTIQHQPSILEDYQKQFMEIQAMKHSSIEPQAQSKPVIAPTEMEDSRPITDLIGSQSYSQPLPQVQSTPATTPFNAISNNPYQTPTSYQTPQYNKI